jgi:pimeloyl-ACP methyl ester carboxylesterase
MDDAIADQRSLIEHLCPGHRVIVHDRRGAGASEREPADISMDAMVADVTAVLTDAGVERAVLLASGEAACLAVHTAVQRPDRVERLVLIDPMLRPLNGPGSSMLLYTLRSKPRLGLRSLARTMVSDDIAADVLGMQMGRTVDGSTAARLYEAFLTAETETVLPRVAAPALFAYGVVDGIVSEDEASGLQGRMIDARVGFVQGPAGSDAALREAWIQIRGFIEDAKERMPAPAPARGEPGPATGAEAGPRRATRSRTASARATQKLTDYVPAAAPPRYAQPRYQKAMAAQTLAPPVMSPPAPARPPMLAWGPPADVPPKAVQLNREGIDRLLVGEIEEALTLFQQAVEIAPHYEDAVVNHRELLSRLVQRRVSEWQARQAEEVIADAERRAQRWAHRAAGKRGGFFRRLFGMAGA